MPEETNSLKSSMAELILVRHSQPERVVGVPASKWRLSAEGRQRCLSLAYRLAPHQPSRVVTSLEPKAIETGQIIAAILNIPWNSMPDLHEHERPEAVRTLAPEAFRARVADLFEYHDQLVLGTETADQAHKRFAAAIADLLSHYQEDTLSVVTHGTVMTLFISRATGLEPVSFWKQLGLPAFTVLSLPDLGLVKLVDKVPKIG
jgi:broad specificity phosphatase PhoE